MNRTDAKKAVRKLAEADRIAFTDHAKKRNPDKGKFPLTREQIRGCLIHGVITEGPAPDSGSLTDGRCGSRECAILKSMKSPVFWSSIGTS